MGILASDRNPVVEEGAFCFGHVGFEVKIKYIE